MLKGVSPGFKQYAENMSINFNVYERGSEHVMSKYDFKDANIDAKQGNVVIGEHQTVTNTVNGTGNEKLEELFAKLISDIKQLSPQDEVEDALDNANKIKAAVEADDQSRAKKLFGWLPTAVQASATALEIFKLFGDNQ